MKVRNYIIGAMAALMTFVSCQEEVERLDVPKLFLDNEEMTFDEAGGEQSLTVTSTRDWTVECDADWVVVNPESGLHSKDPQTVTVSVLPNSGMDRSVNVKFTIGMVNRYLAVKQAGPGGSLEQLILYFNDFDKEEATKTYGSGESWPYLDQFEGWKNQTGTGAANVSYASSGMSARANSTSNSNYADYAGSGSNNLFFGSNAYFATKNIALGGKTDIALSFGTEKYSQTNGSVFTPSEFHIFLSRDGSKWVELKDYTFAGGTTEGRWNLASSVFSVPEGTENLSICMKVDVASSYRMDDLKLEVSMEAGTAVDFSNAVEMDFTAGSTGGGGTTTPSNVKDVTVSEFNAAPVSTTDWYRLKGTVGGPINAQYGNFDLIDETGKVYVYGISNWSEYKSKVAEGGSIVVVGQRGDYNGKIEVLEGYIESYGGSTGGGNQNPEPAGDYIYFNDYDKVEATKTYGSGESWPYLDQFEGWKNEKGPGAANVTYSFKGMSARANSTSDGSYSDYAGSGKNNMFFGKDAYLATKNIALGGKTDLILTFGTEKYSQQSGSVFKNSEYHIYLSQDGSKWVELKDYTFAGGTKEGRWNVATATFSVPAGTENLSISIKVDVASSYRMDDFGLAASTTAGTAVDFSNAVEMDFGEGTTGGGGNTGGDVTPPSGVKTATVAEFLAAAEDDAWYQLTGTVTDLYNTTYGNFHLVDATGDVLVYGLTATQVGSNDKSFSSLGIKEGDTVTLIGQRSSYNGTPQVGGPAYYVSHNGGNQGGGEVTPPSGDPGEYDPQGITWTLGTNAYDATLAENLAQTATVNGVEVSNLLKLGTGSKVGDATLHIPAGTKKVGAYIVAWNKKTATLKASVNGKEVASISPASNTGAAGNPPYTITVTDSDWYEIEVDATSAIDMKVETVDPANGRVIIIGLKAIK